MLRPTRISLLLCLALFASACSDGSNTEQSSDTSAETTTTETTVAETTTTTVVEEEEAVEDAAASDGELLDDSMALDSALALGIEVLQGRELTQAEFDAVFSDEFKEQVPFPIFTLSATQIQAAGPFTIGEEVDREETGVGVAITPESGENWIFIVEVAAVDDATITNMQALPMPEMAEIAGFDEGVAELQDMGTVRLATFDTTGGSCEVIDDAGADEQMPLGSVFKLYVLGAVVDAVEAGEISWDDEVEVRDELDSIPSGITQDDEPGTLLSVEELALRMIAISDNTATDHLIDLVGREAVEAAVADYGHSQPELNRPFLTTKEFTILKFGVDDATRDAFAAADEGQRRTLLAELPTELPPVTAIVTVTDPVEVETLEWFASPADVCRVLTLVVVDPTAREIVGDNPGWPDEDGLFSFVGFKGGSEPGVLAGAWMMETADGQSFVVAGAVSNEDEVVDENAAVGVLAAIRDGVVAG